jgi:peptidoglycan hydrolase-like protein with peptidoglycan-binding domain
MRNSSKYGLRTAAIAGMASAGILISVTAASASTTAPYVRDGDRGYAVWCVQYALNRVYPRLHLDEDSKFGPATLAGVKQLQRDGYLEVDGIVGPETGNLIAGADSSYNDPGCESVIPTTY